MFALIRSFQCLRASTPIPTGLALAAGGIVGTTAAPARAATSITINGASRTDLQRRRRDQRRRRQQLTSWAPFLGCSDVSGVLASGCPYGSWRSFDGEPYKKRNTVERAINRLKGFRAVATRYEKRGYISLGTVTLAALISWLRT